MKTNGIVRRVFSVNFKIDTNEHEMYEFRTDEEIWIDKADMYCDLFRIEIVKKTGEIDIFVANNDDYDVHENVTHLFDEQKIVDRCRDEERLLDYTGYYEIWVEEKEFLEDKNELQTTK
jgi:hypothetical protein